MIEIKCPDTMRFKPLNQTAIFMAGGITGCPDWQHVMVEQLANVPNLILVNPRRNDWDLTKSSKDQITWEYHHLHIVDYTYFWFPKEGMCAITLYELAMAVAKRGDRIRVGVEPGYWRELDVREQLALAAPWIDIVSTLDELYNPVWADCKPSNPMIVD